MYLEHVDSAWYMERDFNRYKKVKGSNCIKLIGFQAEKTSYIY